MHVILLFIVGLPLVLQMICKQETGNFIYIPTRKIISLLQVEGVRFISLIFLGISLFILFV